MSKYIVVIFPSEAKAYEGRRALGELHNEGSITAYASAIITKEKNGHIAVKESADSGPLGAGVGALVGGLAGLVGGPVGVAVGVGAGSLFGSFTDLMNLGVNADFLDAVSETLKPGKSALVAEISEDWVTPIDVRMEALGGNVIRKQRYDFEDEQEERAIRADQAEVARLKEEWKQASAERKAKLKARLDDAQAKLDAAAKHAGERARKLEQQGKAKLQELQHQMAHATGEAKAKLDARMAETRTDYERRSKLLKQAGELAKQALAA
ncbi:MAG: DUF1269 domain-containing protein [Alphaproteobacteria bacterium]|nr:DUF1269 domain-containing protein [Alphaproteobacteria bacterium]